MNITDLQDQECQISFDYFTHEEAWKLGLILVEIARSENLAVAISIEISSQVVFQYSFAGTSADNDRWIQGKRKVTKLYQKSSLHVREIIAATGKSIEEAMHLSGLEYMALGGCIPIRVYRQGMVGTLTVSGLPDEDDHALAMRGLIEFGASRISDKG